MLHKVWRMPHLLKLANPMKAPKGVADAPPP